MYAIKVESPDKHVPVMHRVMSSNNVPELLPVFVEVCRSKFNMVYPVALYMGHNVYRIFDIANPAAYVKVSIVTDCY